MGVGLQRARLSLVLFAVAVVPAKAHASGGETPVEAANQQPGRSAEGHSWQSTSSAEELLREAREHEARQDDFVAIRRYTEALALDPLLGDAYLGLGALRLRRGDPREAVRVYDVALSHL